MKTFFLDIDGVLNSGEWMQKRALEIPIDDR